MPIIATNKENNTVPSFKKGSLVISLSESGNIYLVLDSDPADRNFYGVRLCGKGEWLEVSHYLKSAVKRYDGVVTIENDN